MYYYYYCDCYCTYDDYQVVRKSKLKRKVRLPRQIVDQRGQKEKGRSFGVRWSLNPKLPASLFVKPRVAKKKGDKT